MKYIVKASLIGAAVVAANIAVAAGQKLPVQQVQGMNIGALYIQAVKMTGEGHAGHHAMPMDHSQHQQHKMPMDHSQHQQHKMPMDHSQHQQHAMTDEHAQHMQHGAQAGKPMAAMQHHMNHDGDLHLEAAIHAAQGNAWGFPEGAWMPYLNVTYQISKKGSDWRAQGVLIPMAANDGPHYGANVKMDGPGKYSLTYTVNPPAADVFPRHVDKETGVSGWWEPIELSWDITYVGGVGKKGGY